MSIQSEINRISSEVTTQTDLLGQIAAELAGKAAGGDIEIQTDKDAVTPSNVAQTVWPDSGYDALAKVTVKAIPSEYIVPSGTVSITENGTHDVANYAQAVVSVDAPEPVLQSKEVSPSTSSQTVKPDSGYDGLSQVTVGAMPTATQATPSISVSSAGVITASATQTAGYVIAGTKSATKQLNTQAAKMVTPGTSDQTAVSSGVYTTGAVKVRGDANLLAANIKSGVSIFNVLGTFEGSGSSDSGPYSKAEIITWTPANDTNTVEVAHSLGVVPDGFYVLIRADLANIEDYVITLNMDVNLLYAGVYYFTTGVAYKEGTLNTVLYIIIDFDNDITAQNIKLGPIDYKFMGGATYEILVYKR